MKSKLFAVAVNYIHDSRTNNISLIHILDQIHTLAFPIMLPVNSLLVINKEDGDNEKGNIEFVISLDGKELVKKQLQYDFSGNKTTRVLCTIEMVKIDGPGSLKFDLKNDENVVAQYDIDVIKVGL